MENKEITLLDLVKIAARWIWVLVLGAVICASVAFFYSTQTDPLFSSKSKFVIQTKGQSSDSDIIDSQRTVAYAQLAVGTYIDIVNTDNFAEEVAFYMNGNVKEQKMTESAINALICQGIILDGGVYDYKRDEEGKEILDAEGKKIPSNLRTNILLLGQEDLISVPKDDENGNMVYEVVRGRLLKNNEAALIARGYDSHSDRVAEMDKRLDPENYDKLLKDMIENGEFVDADIYSGDVAEKIAQIDEILYPVDEKGNPLVKERYVSKQEDENNNNYSAKYQYNYNFNKETKEYEAVAPGKGKYRRNGYMGNGYYSAGSIAGKISFSPAKEESTTFDIRVTCGDAKEAYAIAKICEIVIADYVEEVYPGQGVIKTIENAKYNSGQINDNKLLMTLIGFVGGFLLAFVIVYIIELSDNRIKNETELSAKTGLSVVGIIPDMNDDKGNSGYYYYSYGRHDS